MTTLPNRPHTALLVVDVQNEVVARAHGRDAVVGNIGVLVAKARDAQTPVIWVQHDDDDLPPGTDGWEIVPELVPGRDEAVVHKQFRDSFENTTLETELESANVGHLVVTGSQSDYCVRWTLHGARTRGYDTTLVADAHTTDDPRSDALPSAAQVIAHTNAIWGTQAGDQLAASVVRTAEITFG